MADQGGEADKSLDGSLNEEVSAGGTEESEELEAAGGEGASQTKRQRLRTPSPTPTSGAMPFMVQPSPPKFVTFEDLMAAANGVKNMSLAHEIAVDGNFKLDQIEPPSSSIEKQVKDIMHKAFWDMFEEKINEDPPDFGHAVALIEEVKEGLMSILLPQHSRLKGQLNEVLDSELIRQKLDNNAFDIYYYSEYVINIMAKLCSPARDERIAKLREMKEVVLLFREIFAVLDLMKMDMANFTIQQIRPYIQQQSVEYEKKKFEEFLKTQQGSGVDGLELTRQWIGKSYETLSKLNSLDGATQANLVTPAAILNGAYMELLQWDAKKLYPETLVLDQSRLADLRDRTWHLTLVTSVVLVTYNTVGQSIAGVQSLKVKLKNEICTLLEGTEERDLPSVMENIAEQVNKNVEEFLKEHSFSSRDEAQQSSLKGQIKELTSKTNPVIIIMSKRVISFIQQALFSKPMEPLKVPVGMSVMEKELSEICGQFLRLISHNRSVFGAYYADIIGTLLKRDHGDISPRPVS